MRHRARSPEVSGVARGKLLFLPDQGRLVEVGPGEAFGDNDSLWTRLEPDESLTNGPRSGRGAATRAPGDEPRTCRTGPKVSGGRSR